MKLKLTWLLLFIIGTVISLRAQSDSSINNNNDTALHISVLTCGVGEELYSSFGHTGVRVKNTATGSDEVYNYGTFNFGDPDFYTKFTLGKLQYFLDKSSYKDFMDTYVYENRSVDEQEIKLSYQQKIQVIAYLEHNLLPENRGYAYDFLFDNCATRVRDIFPKVLGPKFKYGEILNGKKISFRNILDQYLSRQHWTRMGINLLLGSKVDKLMTDESSMFLPDFLYKGLETASINGEIITLPNVALLPKTQVPQDATWDIPFWVFTAVLVLLIIAYFVPALRGLKSFLNFLLLFVTGLLGCFMLFMWLGTNHQCCGYNWNVLWALPFNVVIAFFAWSRKPFLKLYALAGISLLIVALLINIIGLQQMPLMEVIPLLAALMFIYIDMYKRNIDTRSVANQS